MNIEVSNLNKDFGDFRLENINFSVKKGSIVGLIGENGAGKTTLIKCILDVMKKDSGKIFIFEKEFTDELKNEIGVVFDDSFINQTFNMKDINKIMKSIYKNWDQEMFFKFIKDFKIPKNKEMKKLSTGMKKKVEIATCLSHHPKLLILDEPTSGLDPVIRSEILDLFTNFVKKNDCSILLSTHITSDLEHIADDIIFISKGKIIFNKPLKNVKEDYIMLEMNEKDFASFNKKSIIRYKKNRNDYQVMITKKEMKKDYQKFIKNITTLDDIMLLYIRGEICTD